MQRPILRDYYVTTKSTRPGAFFILDYLSISCSG